MEQVIACKGVLKCGGTSENGEDRKRWSVIERIEIDIKVKNGTQ